MNYSERQQAASRILFVDDDEDILVAGKLLLKRHFSEVTAERDPERIPDLMAVNRYDAILLDMNFAAGETSGRDGLTWLERIKRIDGDAVVVLITAYSSVDAAVMAMKLGAVDFIEKPWVNERLVATLNAAVELSRTRREANSLRQKNRELVSASAPQGQTILGESAGIGQVLSMIERAGPTDANVLILGENGTGKELVARAIHRASRRAGEAFISVDAGALPEGLFESELFGHKKGAFTDAKQDRIGRFQAASGGTIFLDEIGNVPIHLQAKLLTVLEQRQVTPVGSDKPVGVDVRVISATNVSPTHLGDENRFRPDLLYRLNTVEIHVPPLRNRAEDIPVLARAFLAQFARKYDRGDVEFSDDAIALLQSNSWPGNVRALRHAVERAVILAEGGRLGADDFAFLEAGPSVASSRELPNKTLGELEEIAVRKAIERNNGNISKAARELGLTRASLYRRLEKYDL